MSQLDGFNEYVLSLTLKFLIFSYTYFRRVDEFIKMNEFVFELRVPGIIPRIHEGWRGIQVFVSISVF